MDTQVYTVIEIADDFKNITAIITCSSLEIAKSYLNNNRKLLGPHKLIVDKNEKIVNHNPLFDGVNLTSTITYFD